VKALTLQRTSCRFVESVCSLAIVFLSIESITAQVAPAPVVNGKIVFTRGDANGLNPEIYVMDPDGSNQTNLSNNPAGARRRGWYGDFGPAWSSDGAKIVFASQRYPYSAYPHIYVMNADGSNQIRLTHNDWNRGGVQYGFERDPVWSPDGSKIAFVSSPRNVLQIYVMDADGSNQIPLTNNSSPGDEAPAWSPDGSRIAFMRYGVFVGGPLLSEIYVMNADGSNQVRLTDSPGRVNELPVWSPDGSKIAFDSNRGSNGYYIYVMDPDGSNQMALTKDQGQYVYGPEWSPDGTKIVFTGGFQIFVMDADGSNQTFLAIGHSPRWQRLPALFR
jgi:Tol biopolymer transport system component